jgi:hypothetical protein
VVFRKYFVPALVIGAALFAVACQEPSAQLEFVNPKDGQKVLPQTIVVKVRWTGVNCVAERISLDIEGESFPDMGISPMPETVSWIWYPVNLPSGTERWLVAKIRFHAPNDKTIFEQSESIQVTVDSGGPVVRFVSPLDGDTLEPGDVLLKVWAVDAGVTGMDRVEFLVDDVLDGTATSATADTWHHWWEARQASAGGHSIKAKAFNNDGVMEAATINVTIRDTASGGGPTYHHGYVDTGEVWSPSGNPHIVDADVAFRNGARLTIEPGCIVKFDNFALYIGTQGDAGLTAVGTASAPILFTSNQASPAPGDWTGILFGADVLTGTRLNYCTIEYAGFHAFECAAITMGGGGKVDEISNCTIRNGGMYGIFCREYAGFGAFSNNAVTANQGYPLRVDAGLAELLDDGNTLTGNDSAGVELYGRLRTTTTWPDLGVPYVIKDVSVGDSTNNPVLTIQPGTEIRLKDIGVLRVGKVGANLPARIVADGSAGRITFTSAAPTPVPGGFYGINVYGNLIGESEFKSCDFSYGGQDGAGMLFVNRSNPVITGCDFGYSEGWGILFQTATVPDTAALRQVNTFHNNALGDMKWMPAFRGE